MRWSLSMGKMFSRCPKKWCYSTVFADSKSDDVVKREAATLKNLQSIHSWRGKLVDDTISQYVIPKINRKAEIEPESVMAFSKKLADRQLDYAMKKKYREEHSGIDSETDSEFCALYEIEYGKGIEESIIKKAREESETSLMNFFHSDVLTDLVENARYSLPQRLLQFHFADCTIVCKPDLIVFMNDGHIKIIDWKVQAPTNRENWLQLGLYGIAFARAKPHSDYPKDLLEKIEDAKNKELIEFQLLRNQKLEYRLTAEDITEIDDYVFDSCLRIGQMLNGKPKEPDQLLPLMPTARSPESCSYCNFKKICWVEVAL